MRTKRSSRLLQVCVVLGALALAAQSASAQVARSRWSRASLYGPRAWTARPQPVAQPETRTPDEAVSLPTLAQDATTVSANANTNANTTTNTNTNTNIVIVRPQQPTYFGYGGYAGYPYAFPGYWGRTTYRYFDRGIFNAVPGPFGLSSLRPLEVTTIP